MTLSASERSVLQNLPGPLANGRTCGKIAQLCFKQDGLNDEKCWHTVCALVDRGLVERFERTDDDGTRYYYRLTQNGQREIRAITQAA